MLTLVKHRAYEMREKNSGVVQQPRFHLSDLPVQQVDPKGETLVVEPPQGVFVPHFICTMFN